MTKAPPGEDPPDGDSRWLVRALIAVALWVAISIPLALLVARIIRAAGVSGIADEAERWLRARSISRSERRRAMVARTILTVVLLAPLAAAGAVAAWRLPSLMTVTRADGPLALAWPPGQQDASTTTSTSAPAEEDEPVVTATADAAERNDVAVDAELRQPVPARSGDTTMAAAAAPGWADDDEPPPTTTTTPSDGPMPPSTTTPPARCEPGTTSTTTPPEAREEPTADPPCPDDDASSGSDDDARRSDPETTESAPEGSTAPDETGTQSS